MSRSYKKTHITKTCKFSTKRRANKVVRLSKELYSNSYFKKLFDSYDLADVIIYEAGVNDFRILRNSIDKQYPQLTTKEKQKIWKLTRSK